MDRGSGIGDSKTRKFFHRHVYTYKTHAGKSRQGRGAVGARAWGSDSPSLIPASGFRLPGYMNHDAGIGVKDSGLIFKTGFSKADRFTRYHKLLILN
jgi:hypothetical protein